MQNLAFMILAHTDFDQLIRLCEKLVDYGDIYIHVDKRTDDDYVSRLHTYISTTNVSHVIKLINHRINVTWGGYSQVRAIMTLVEATLYGSKRKYDRVFLISGLCYPLSSPEKMRRYCEENQYQEYLSAINITQGDDMRQKRRVILYLFFRDINLPHKSFIRKGIIGGSRLLLRCLHFRKRPYLIVNNTRWDVYKSAEWVGLTDVCWRYVYDQLKQYNEIRNYFQTSYAPDELVIATIVMNSEFGRQAHLSRSRRLEDLSMLHYLRYTDHIWTYDEKDFEKLINSGKPFVRKLMSGKSEKLIEMINNLHMEWEK